MARHVENKTIGDGAELLRKNRLSGLAKAMTVSKSNANGPEGFRVPEGGAIWTLCGANGLR